MNKGRLRAETIHCQAVNRAVVLHYERFTANPRAVKEELAAVLGFEEVSLDWSLLRTGLNGKYFKRWRSGDAHMKGPYWKRTLKRLRNRREIRNIERCFEARLNCFGYSFSGNAMVPYVDADSPFESVCPREHCR